jgi:hypothetical protein
MDGQDEASLFANAKSPTTEKKTVEGQENTPALSIYKKNGFDITFAFQ